jgi:putative hydrolase of the HAD superfamily
MKKKRLPIKALFVDIGGVLLTNGWDHHARERAAKAFDLDYHEMESRHQLTFDTFEVGKISLEVYLTRVVFYQKRSFTHSQFEKFMYAQSKAFPEMLELMRKVKAQNKLKIVAVSNEGRELNKYRIQKFKLNDFIDFFVSSSYVHFRKPDQDIYRLALDVSQVPPNQIVYVEDRQLFVEVGEELGLHGLHHTDYKSTRAKLVAFGLAV